MYSKLVNNINHLAEQAGERNIQLVLKQPLQLKTKQE